jgi:hypothetical protein
LSLLLSYYAESVFLGCQVRSCSEMTFCIFFCFVMLCQFLCVVTLCHFFCVGTLRQFFRYITPSRLLQIWMQ